MNLASSPSHTEVCITTKLRKSNNQPHSPLSRVAPPDYTRKQQMIRAYNDYLETMHRRKPIVSLWISYLSKSHTIQQAEE